MNFNYNSKKKMEERIEVLLLFLLEMDDMKYFYSIMIDDFCFVFWKMYNFFL